MSIPAPRRVSGTVMTDAAQDARATRLDLAPAHAPDGGRVPAELISGWWRPGAGAVRNVNDVPSHGSAGCPYALCRT
jgi:hypothetical protein